MDKNDFEVLLNKIKQSKFIEDKIDTFGGFTNKTVQSDKIGYDWIEEYLGDVLVKQTYVEQENPVGVADNPFNFTVGVQLMPNAYYMYKDERYVYVGESKIAKKWIANDFEKI